MNIKDIARAAGVSLFEYDGSYRTTKTAKAADLLDGRTHYLSPGTRQFFGATVVHLSVIDEGLTLGMVERVRLGFDRIKGHGFRPVFIDTDGHVHDRLGIDDAYKTKAAALKEFWRIANTFTAEGTLRAILTRQESAALRSLDEARAGLASLTEEVAA